MRIRGKCCGYLEKGETFRLEWSTKIYPRRELGWKALGWNRDWEDAQGELKKQECPKYAHQFV